MQMKFVFSTNRKALKTVENALHKEFLSLHQWFIDNKLSINFGKDKTKSILFSLVRGLTLFRMDFFVAAHGWGEGGQKGPPP